MRCKSGKRKIENNEKQAKEKTECEEIGKEENVRI